MAMHGVRSRLLRWWLDRSMPHGLENRVRKFTRRVVLGSALAIGLAVVPVTAANAALTSQSAGGGLWQWGIQSGQVVSNYHHATRYHTATACDDRVFQTCIQKAAAANAWAKASTSAGSSFGATNKSYWNAF